jgi:hypothetical protein
MSEIYVIFFRQIINDEKLTVLEIFYYIFGIITIIPISIVLIAIRKRSKCLYILFNVACLIEVAIILSRLLWSFLRSCNSYMINIYGN